MSKPMVRQSATGGLWMTDANWKAALHLKNSLKTDPITVTPILYLSNGRGYPLPRVTLEPSGTAIVDLGQALASVGIAPYATLYGYVEVEYQWPWAAVTASVKNTNVVDSLIFIFGLQPSPDWVPEHMESMPARLPASFEGMWWKQEKDVSGFVALSNVTGQPIHATVRLTDATDAQITSYQVTVSPHGTKMLTLAELTTAIGNAGGIYLTHDGPERGLDINGGLQDTVVGYSANLHMVPQLKPPSSPQAQPPTALSFSELGLMTGVADPMMNFPSGTVFTPYSLVRNISDQPATVTPELWWMAGGSPQSAMLPQMTISPHHTLNLNAPALLAAAGLKSFNGSVNLILDTRAQAGGLALSSGSVDQRNTYEFEVVPRAISDTAAKAMCYWSTGNGDDTMVTLWNPADEAQDLAFTLFYTGGQYVYAIHLGPRETRTFNISDILRSGIPDVEGNVIPAAISEGSAEVSGSLGEQQHILISVDAGVYNVRKATCGVYCWNCTGVASADVALAPFGVGISKTTQETFYETNASGYQYSHTASWGSSATSIATVNGSGLVSGVRAGSISISAVDPYSETIAGQVCSDQYNICPTDTFSASAPGDVFQFVVQGNPYIFVGTDPNIVSANTYFATNGSGGAPQPPGGTITATSSDSSDSVTVGTGQPATIKFKTLDQSTSSGDRNLTFKYTLSSGENASQQINVTAREFAYVTNNSPSNQCTLGYGTDRLYVYTVYTHPDKTAVTANDGLDGTPVTENFSPAVQCGTITSNGSIDVNGQFSDHVSSGCSSQPISCTQTTTQTIKVAGYLVRTNTLQTTTTGVNYTNNGPTQ